MALIQLFAESIKKWKKQHEALLRLLERIQIYHFKYPTEMPASLRTSLQPSTYESLQHLYFSSEKLEAFLEEELGNSIARSIHKIEAIIKEFEECYSKTAVDVIGKSEIKKRRQTVTSRVQKLNHQLVRWLQNFIKKTFSVLSLLYSFAGKQFEGRLTGEIGTEESDLSNAASEEFHGVTPQLYGSGSQANRVSPSIEKSSFSPSSSVPLNGRTEHTIANICGESGVEFLQSSTHVLASPETPAVSESFPKKEEHWPVHVMVAENNVDEMTFLPVLSQPQVSSPQLSFEPSSNHLLPSDLASVVNRPTTSRFRHCVMSAREWGGKAYSPEALIEEHQKQVDIGRIAFDNLLTLSFAYVRSLEKAVEGVLKGDKQFDNAMKVVRKAHFSLNDYVFQRYSQVHAMLPLNLMKKAFADFFSKPSRLGRKLKSAKTGITTFYSVAPDLSDSSTPQNEGNRNCAHADQMENMNWLDRSFTNLERKGRYDAIDQELIPNPLKEAPMDALLLTAKQRKIRLGDFNSSLSTKDSTRTELLHHAISSSSHGLTRISGPNRSVTILSPKEIQKRKTLCKNIFAFDAFITSSFQSLSDAFVIAV